MAMSQKCLRAVLSLDATKRSHSRAASIKWRSLSTIAATLGVGEAAANSDARSIAGSILTTLRWLSIWANQATAYLDRCLRHSRSMAGLITTSCRNRRIATRNSRQLLDMGSSEVPADLATSASTTMLRTILGFNRHPVLLLLHRGTHHLYQSLYRRNLKASLRSARNRRGTLNRPDSCQSYRHV